MNGPTTLRTTVWTNTPDNRRKLFVSSHARLQAREAWAKRQVQAALLRTQPTQGPAV